MCFARNWARTFLDLVRRRRHFGGCLFNLVVDLWVWWEMTEWEGEGYGCIHNDPLPFLLPSDDTRGAYQTPLSSLMGGTTAHERCLLSIVPIVDVGITPTQQSPPLTSPPPVRLPRTCPEDYCVTVPKVPVSRNPPHPTYPKSKRSLPATSKALGGK